MKKFFLFIMLSIFLLSCESNPDADLTAGEEHSTGTLEEETTYAKQRTHYNYNGKFVLRRDRSHIIHEYWKRKFEFFNPDWQSYFRHFYELWKGLENLPSANVTQATIYKDFRSFCRGEGIEKEFVHFWNFLH